MVETMERKNQCDVLLLVPPGINYNTPPLGLLSIATVLRMEGIGVTVLDAAIEALDLEEVFAQVQEVNPKIVGVGICTPDFKLTDQFLFLLKKRLPHIWIVAGGPHSTIDPSGVLSSKHIDFAIRGEGEYSLLELARSLLKEGSVELEQIKGLSFRKGDSITHNPARVLIEDLDSLPLPARDLIPLMKYRNYGRVRKRWPIGVMITSRGCPYQCIFCAHEIFGHSYRTLSASKMIEEIKYLQEHYGVKEILFRDDNFTADRARIFEFCERIIKENIDITWMCLAHVNNIEKDMVQLMKKAGCWHIGLGVESGNQEIHKTLKKGVRLERAREAFDIIQEAGIKTLAFFMIGNYLDSNETVRDTVNFAKSLNTDFAIFTITTLFPGTELYEYALQQNLIADFDIAQISNNPLLFGQKDSVLRTPYLSGRQLRRWQLRAIIEFYLRPAQLWRILKDQNLARAFLNIQPKEYVPNTRIIQEIERKYASYA